MHIQGRQSERICHCSRWRDKGRCQFMVRFPRQSNYRYQLWKSFFFYRIHIQFTFITRFFIFSCWCWCFFFTWRFLILCGAFQVRWLTRVLLCASNRASKSVTGLITTNEHASTVVFAHSPSPDLVWTRNITVHRFPLFTDIRVEVVLRPYICL